MEIVRYKPDYKKQWDDFVESSKNGTFLFNRSYMDYHSDRFEDHSLLFYRKEKLYALLPANIEGKTIYSHKGLTYGGLVMSEKCTTEGVLEIFNNLKDYLESRGINKFIYKPVPYIYNRLPSEEDLYALFRNGFKLKYRNISSCLPLPSPIKFKKDRREAVRRARRNGLICKETDDYSGFWKILEDNLKRKYGAKPVHTFEEISSLASMFSTRIKLICAYEGEEMLGGVVGFFMHKIIHCQYISATPEGKSKGAIDLIISNMMENAETGIDWFDLGTSNEEGGKILNSTLIYQKEGFGGRGICYDTYEAEFQL